MISKLEPVVNSVYFINKYTMFHVLEGTGGLQVDFKNYHNWQDKIIFLDKGQYVKFLSDDFVVRRIEFEDQTLFQNKDVRVLFKHLVSLGYINFNDCLDCQRFLSDSALSDDVAQIIDISSKHWYWQNPFGAERSEYHLIFDVKDIIDERYKNHLSNEELSLLMKDAGHRAHAIYRDRVGITIKKLLGQKRLTESQKVLAYGKHSIKEVAYEFGYNDPSYFNRAFKQQSGMSPSEFRKGMQLPEQDMFVQDLYILLREHHQAQRQLHFYAEKMHLSPKSLSQKVKRKLHISLGQLIRLELIKTAKGMLLAGESVGAVANQLGFEEANHFSSFFTLHTGETASNFISKKYK